jgi:NUDE protein, C-terminal conserved region
VITNLLLQTFAKIMPPSDGIPSSSPGPSTSSADAIAYYKAQYETLEAELADFQASSKELEAELEKDIEASEKRERQFKEKADNLNYEVNEWKTKYKQSKTEANSAQNTLQKEITTLRDTNRTLQMRLRDIEVANDDYERQQRNTESSLEDLESKYNQAIERSVMMEEEVKVGEQEREALRIEAQRLRDELSDLRIEAEITREKLRKAEENMENRRNLAPLQPVQPSASPRSELSPTTSDSTPSLDTPPGKTASSSGLSDTHTPPSPPISERSAIAPKPFKTPSIPKTRLSITSNNTTPRPSTFNSKPPQHNRGPSIPAVSGRSTPSVTFRQSISRPSTAPHRPAGLTQSNSIYHLHNLQGKMQRLTERVHTAKSKLPGPVNTPPKASPRTGPTVIGSNIPATVTVRSSRKRAGGSTINGTDSLPDPQQTSVGTPSVKARPSRQSLTMGPPTSTPTPSHTRNEMHAPTSINRPGSRLSNISATSSTNRTSNSTAQTPDASRPAHGYKTYQPSHSRPGSRASISLSTFNNNNRTPLGAGLSRAPNASTDRVRPKSSLSNYGTDGAMDDDDVPDMEGGDIATPTPRRTTMRISDVGLSGIPTPGTATGMGTVKGTSKRTSISRLPAPRASLGGLSRDGELSRPSSSHSVGSTKLSGVGEDFDDETF